MKWAALDECKRSASASKIQESQRDTLLAYSERMASLAVRDKRTDLITLGLLALGVDGWTGDWRDNVAIVSLHYDAARRLAVDIDVLFTKAAALLPERPAEALLSFLRRSPTDRSLEAMGYAVGKDIDGFRYKRTW